MSRQKHPLDGVARGHVVIARLCPGRAAMERERIAPGESYAVLESLSPVRGMGAVRVAGVVVHGVPFRRAPVEVQP